MKIIRAINRKENGSAILSKYAYLFLVEDIAQWFWSEDGEIIIPQAPELKEKAFIFRLYTTPNSNKYSLDLSGNHDQRGYQMKFSGTHPGRSEEALKFIEKYLDLGFIVMIPECGQKTVVLGTPDNPMFFTSSHENGSGGRKFTMNFEQEMKDDFVYRLGNFSVEEGSDVVDYATKLRYVLADPSGTPIIFTNNILIEIP